MLSSSLTWPVHADLGQEQVALVAVALVGGQGDRHPPRPALVLPLAEAAGHRHDVGVAEVLEGLGGEGGADAAGAVDDDRRVVVGQAALDLALQVAPGDVERARQGALVVLVGLPDVEHDGAGPAERRPRPRRCRLRGSRPWRTAEQVAERGHGRKATGWVRIAEAATLVTPTLRFDRGPQQIRHESAQGRAGLLADNSRRAGLPPLDQRAPRRRRRSLPSASLTTLPTASALTDPGTAAAQFLMKTNQTRAAAGLAPLVRDGGLDAMAGDWSNHMAGVFAAQRRPGPGPRRPERLQPLGPVPPARPGARPRPPSTRAGARAARTSASAATSTRSRTPSSSRRATTPTSSGDYDRVGIGVVTTADHIWVTLDFMQAADHRRLHRAWTPPSRPARGRRSLPSPRCRARARFTPGPAPAPAGHPQRQPGGRRGARCRSRWPGWARSRPTPSGSSST